MDKGDAKARTLNSIVLSPNPKQPFSCDVPLTDVQTTSTRALVLDQQRNGQVVSCTHRCVRVGRGRRRCRAAPRLPWLARTVSGRGCNGSTIHHCCAALHGFFVARRYLLNVKHLMAALTGPNAFHVKVQVRGAARGVGQHAAQGSTWCGLQRGQQCMTCVLQQA